MTVGELKTRLAAYPDDTEIMLSSDSEGNAYAGLCEVSDGLYGDLSVEWHTAEARGSGEDRRVAVLLWPIN